MYVPFAYNAQYSQEFKDSKQENIGNLMMDRGNGQIFFSAIHKRNNLS